MDYLTIKALLLAIVVTFLLIVIGSTGWNLVTYHNSRHNCQQIELLKARVRARAIQEKKDLPKTAKLIGIKVTPQLIAAENKALARTLKDYAPEKCAGLFG